MLFCYVIIVSVLALLFVVVPVSGLLYNKDQNHLLPKLAVFQSYRILIHLWLLPSQFKLCIELQGVAQTLQSTQKKTNCCN